MFDWIDFTVLSGIMTVTLLYIVCIVSPGPDFAMIVRNSLMYSRRTGMFTALGTSLGLTFHATYTLIGIAVLVKNSPWGFKMMQAVGACYLCYIGYQSFRTKHKTLDEMSVDNVDHDISKFSAVRYGFLTDALNPMAMMFFFTMFATVITEHTTTHIKVLYGVIIFTLGLGWFTFVAVCFSHPKVRALFARLGHWLGRITGGVLVSLGVKLAFMINP